LIILCSYELGCPSILKKLADYSKMDDKGGKKRIKFKFSNQKTEELIFNMTHFPGMQHLEQ